MSVNPDQSRDLDPHKPGGSNNDTNPSPGKRLSRNKRRSSSERSMNSAGSLGNASDTEMLRRVVRALECSDWNPNNVAGLLKQIKDSRNTIETTACHYAQLELDPHTQRLMSTSGRMLKAGPSLVDYRPGQIGRSKYSRLVNCGRWNFQKSGPSSRERPTDLESQPNATESAASAAGTRASDKRPYVSIVRASNHLPASQKASDSRPPVFIIIGLFDGPDMMPKERIVYIHRPRWIFWNLWWAIVRLRGLRYLFSLKDCSSFGLYSVSVEISFIF